MFRAPILRQIGTLFPAPRARAARHFELIQAQRACDAEGFIGTRRGA
jgi:hypothetical protein